MTQSSQSLIERAADRLRSGGLVAFPTETVYGLGADALNPDAVARVFEIKRRPMSSPLIVHVADEDMARSVASAWPEEAGAIAGAFWPGPVSIIVPRADRLPEVVTGGGATVASDRLVRDGSIPPADIGESRSDSEILLCAAPASALKTRSS